MAGGRPGAGAAQHAGTPAPTPPPACRPGLSARQPLFGRPPPGGEQAAGGDDHVQINLEAGPSFDIDSEIDQLRHSVGKLKEVRQRRQQGASREGSQAAHGKPRWGSLGRRVAG